MPVCPACNKPMKRRSSARGAFWGCSGYPSCRRTLPIIAADAAPSSSDDTAPVDTTSTEARESWKPPEPPSYSEAASAYAAALARLDSDQRNVVEWDPSAGNLRVIAAAGSGKTSSVVALVSKLVREQIRTPAQIIATTFTSKAGKELAERLNRTLPPGALPQMRVGTFHGLALRALRGQGSWDMPHCLDIGRRAAGVPSSGQLWGKALGYAGEGGMPGTGVEGLGLEEPDVKAYQLAVDVVRSRGVVGAELVDALQEVERESGLPYLVKAWSMVCDSKRALGAWDFADALQAWHDHLTRCEATPDVVVFVDEAQDNSKLQLDIARLLTRSGNLVLIGDLRQSIYSWRGAYPELFLHADKEINAATLQLRNNYRSGTSIVTVGNHCAEGQDWCVGDAAVAARMEAGKVDVRGYSDPADESRAVAESISRLAHDSDTPLDSVAILCRTNALSGAFEAACIAASIPCVVVGGKPFFQRFEVMNALAYVKLSTTDDLDAFARIVNKPRRYLGAKFVQAVKARLHTAGDLLAAVDSCITSLYPKQRDAAQEFYVWLSALRASKWPDALEMIVRLLSPAASSDSGEADNDRSGIVAAVASIGKYFPSAAAFCDFAERCAGEVVEARAEDGGFVLPTGRVTISTIHRAKGLEWKHVYVSASAGVFPHAKSTSPARIAEERRLFYVAATRAKDELHLTHSAVDLYGRTAGPSPFLQYVEGPDGTPPSGGEPIDADHPVMTRAEVEADAAKAYTAVFPAAEVTPAGNLVQHLDLSGVPAPAELTPIGVLFGREAWAAALARARAGTVAEVPVEGGRYTPVWLESFETLLDPLGFTRTALYGQEVFEWATQREHGDLFLRVYTSIPVGEDITRDVGEDSIKVAAVWFAGDKEKPLHKKLPYACRTRGWRVALLDRIEEVASKIAVQCLRCSSPMRERKAMKAGSGAHAFLGCIRWPACSGTREVK